MKPMEAVPASLDVVPNSPMPNETLKPNDRVAGSRSEHDVGDARDGDHVFETELIGAAANVSLKPNGTLPPTGRSNSVKPKEGLPYERDDNSAATDHE